MIVDLLQTYASYYNAYSERRNMELSFQDTRKHNPLHLIDFLDE